MNGHRDNRLNTTSELHQTLHDVHCSAAPPPDLTIRQSLIDVGRLLRQARQSLGGMDYKLLGISCDEKDEVATQSNPQDEPLVAIVQQLGQLAEAVAGVAAAINKKL